MTAVQMAADPQLVRTLRAQVADRLNQQRRSDEVLGRSPMSPEDERQYARSLVVQVLEDHARAEISLGRTPPSVEVEEALASAIHAALFGVGRLQPLLQDPDVENVDINGCDRVFVGYADGREELVEPGRRERRGAGRADPGARLQRRASRRGRSTPPTRSSTSAPRRVPALRRDVGLRAAQRLDPPVAARQGGHGGPGRQRHDDPRAGVVPPAAVRARKNVMIAGSTNSGKTTLLRALANEIPAERAADHRRACPRARARPLRGPAPQRGRVRGAAAQLRGPGRGLHGRAGTTQPAPEPEPGDRRRGARRRDRDHAQRDEPGQRRLAVDDPRELLDGGVQPHLDLRAPGAGAPAGRGDAHADRGLDQLRGLHAQAQRLHLRRLADPRRSRACARSPASTAACSPARCSRSTTTASRCRTQPISCIDDLVQHGYSGEIINRWA